MVEKDVKSDESLKVIEGLITHFGGAPGTLKADLTTQMIQTCLKLMIEGHDLWEMKLINRALKEMRHAYHIFAQYPDARCVSIFGSARTPETHPDFKAAETFSHAMAMDGWMCITGAADGIMRAGIKGAQLESSFGLSIRLPFEDNSKSIIKGDPKLMIFNYFFTRKLMFLSQAHAVAAFPGGVGTMDELFEVLTLMQTGKSSIIPLVLLEGENGHYWKGWEHYMNTQLLDNGWISPSDYHFYYKASSPEDAKKHILHFYKRYHSSRYVKELLVIRMKSPLTLQQVEELNAEFGSLLAAGKMELSSALPEEEEDHPELPRLIFAHNRKNYGLLRALIDKINAY